MNESKISVRYSKAIFKLAKEENIVETIKKDMQILFEATKIDNFKEFMHSPIISISQKQQIFKKIFENELHKHTLSFLHILASNRRESYLEIITRNFLTLYREELGIKEVLLTTVSLLSSEHKNQIKEILKEFYKSKIEFKEKINKEIIGGFIIKIDDQQIDASVSSKLKKFKKELVN